MMKVKSESEVAQSCPTLRDPMDCSLPGSSVHGIFQARVLEWGAIAFSNESNLRVPQQMNKEDLACIHTMEYYSFINFFLTFATIWINLEGVMLSEMSDIER